MNQRPVAISLLLCEQVIVDEKTRNATPVNCFNARRMVGFPGQASFYALAWLTDGLGEMTIELAVQRLDNLERVFHGKHRVEFANPLQEIRCAIHIGKCPLPVAGFYEASLVVDREAITTRKFAATKIGEIG